MDQKLAARPGYQEQAYGDDGYGHPSLHTQLRATRLAYLRTHRNLGRESMRLHLAEDIGRRAALLRIDLQALPSNFPEGLRHCLGYGNPSSIAVLQMVLRQNGNQRDPERPNIGCRGESAAG
jgi:hypothetical protein